MGQVCNSFCSKTDSINQEQPDTQSMIGKRSEVSSIYDAGTIEGNITQSTSVDARDDIYREFHQSVAEGNDAQVEYFMGEENEDGKLLEAVVNHETALFVAVRHRQYSLMEYLIEHKASVE